MTSGCGFLGSHQVGLSNSGFPLISLQFCEMEVGGGGGNEAEGEGEGLIPSLSLFAGC